MPLRPAVRVIEAISLNDQGQDAPIITELLKMAGWKYSRHEITGKNEKQEREQFLKKLLTSNERLIHISAHGNASGGLAIGSSGISVSGTDISAYCKSKKLSASALSGRFITISACGEISGRLAVEINKVAGATAVISPLMEVGFAESAVFMVLFYFALAKYPKLSGLSSPSSADSQMRTSHRIAHYIDSFQRSKQAYLGIGGTGAFRLDYWWQDEHMCLH
jgi:hypothetical protein